MKAIVLVGGSGTRLRPLTSSMPKALLPIVNRPLISYLLTNLHKHGVEEVIFAASATESSLEKALQGDLEVGPKLSFVYETEPLGSGLAVKNAARDIASSFLVCNGDIITDLDLTAMMALHRKQQAIVSISLTEVEDPSSFGVVAMDESDRIVQFVEKPARGMAPSNHVNAGTWIFEPDVLDYIPGERLDGSLERKVFPSLIAANQIVQGFVSDAYFMDVGTPERYLQVNQDILGCQDLWSLKSSSASEAMPCPIGEESVTAPSAKLTESTVLGARCVIGDGAVIRGSILWDGVQVAAQAIVESSILGRNCLIGARSVIIGCVLGDGVTVLPDSVIRGERLAADEHSQVH